MDEIQLREFLPDDMPILYENEADPVAIQMAAFTSRNMPSREAFDSRMERMKADPSVVFRVVVYNGAVVGSVGSWDESGERQITYWISRPFWGKGIATKALEAHLAEIKTRPIFAAAAHDNLASKRVLEKCGFKVIGSDKAFANGRGEETEETLFRLDAEGGSTGAVVSG